MGAGLFPSPLAASGSEEPLARRGEGGGEGDKGMEDEDRVDETEGS